MLAAAAQVPTAPVEGLRDNTPRLHALVHARVIPEPGKIIENGVIVVQDGVIAAVGANVEVPKDARVWDMTGQTVYPGFIDSYSRLGLPKAWLPLPDRPSTSKLDSGEKPVTDPPSGATYWNPLVTPQHKVTQALVLDDDALEKARDLGFTAAWVVPGRGIFRGQSAIINLDDASPNNAVIKPDVAQHINFELNESRDLYPNSLMGCIALIRQVLLDASWYADANAAYAKNPAGHERPEANAALAALGDNKHPVVPFVLEADNELDLLRMSRIAAEFKFKPALLGNGYEYRVLPELEKTKFPLIVPLNFPEVPEIETPEKALDIPLSTLEHWDRAPDNPAKIAAAKIPFALTASGIKDPAKQFWPSLRLAVKRGLSPDAALAALTIEPARLTGVSDRLGTIAPGKIANFTIVRGDIFSSDDAAITSTWIDGKNHDSEAADRVDFRGKWPVTWTDGAAFELEVAGNFTKPEAKIGAEKVAISLAQRQIAFIVPAKGLGIAGDGSIRFSGLVSDDFLSGTGQLPDGSRFQWNARRPEKFVAKIEPPKPSPREKSEPIPDVYPVGEFGRSAPPSQQTVFVNDATIWTSGPHGILEQADLIVSNGRILAVSKNLVVPPGAVVIEAAGKHVTPGIVDCHSHTAISQGVNEATSAVTCEVSVGDVIDATDINIYRQLAGGVTTVNRLHGSANPMGGQNSVIKLRWGAFPEEMKFADAMPGVKFALGENVKQSNWGDKFTTRYPQTRMGVYQLLRETFLAAEDYEKQLQLAKETGFPVRRNLRLEAVLEILNNQRVVHIHSYRQDEVLAFIRLAQEFKFTVATFQHVLEGYKVADEIAKLPAGASSFADWWGYKFEVYDAIPDNPAILEKLGVVTSVNSDSDELARRLNIEAAKSVKYGGLTPEEALKLITINPARQLRIDQQVGSIEPGKDADFVLWTGNPLSTYTRVEQTWIDGRKYFDHVEDLAQRKNDEALREKLVQKALPERLKILESGDKPGEDATKGDTQPVSESAFHWWAAHQSLYNDGRYRTTCSENDTH
ncbi:MAG TPA: amidohydrolase family protein [Chthoniobacterales bacterium]